MQQNGKLEFIELAKITPCPYQTRYTYSHESIQQLIDSVKQNGILQPLTATETEGGYQLISGHRRLFAATILKMDKVPVVVVEKTAEEIAVLCAVENMHREDLNFFEQAAAIKLLIDQLGLTQQQAGERLCLSQSAVANKLKLLQFEKNISDRIIKSGLTERHARALARLDKEKQPKALEYIIKHSLNVSETDRYIEGLLLPKKAKRKTVIHIKDIRIFTNSINKAVGIMKSAGFAAKVEQNITETAAEYKIVIPLEKTEKGRKEKCLADKTAI
ncbi:MAG: ParB/RepB/Spo0J family partition protein [Oscillospiraceae bacterium]|nr:ParB/RepB/Spo0J family partition protein [Oscillospiraceae bacterium]